MKISELLWTAGRAASSLPRWVGICVVVALALYVRYFWPDPKNERVAEGLVASGYQIACSNASEEQYDPYDWKLAERQYGRVLRWHISARQRTLFRHGWAFNVDVTRERAETQERVQATAGSSNVYGYYMNIDSVSVESAHPRRIK